MSAYLHCASSDPNRHVGLRNTPHLAFFPQKGDEKRQHSIADSQPHREPQGGPRTTSTQSIGDSIGRYTNSCRQGIEYRATIKPSGVGALVEVEYHYATCEPKYADGRRQEERRE